MIRAEDHSVGPQKLTGALPRLWNRRGLHYERPVSTEEAATHREGACTEWEGKTRTNNCKDWADIQPPSASVGLSPHPSLCPTTFVEWFLCARHCVLHVAPMKLYNTHHMTIFLQVFRPVQLRSLTVLKVSALKSDLHLTPGYVLAAHMNLG
jgi:hypothetical protein